VSQFLKISELMEAHRVASISYGKLARDIKLELSLPISDRHHSGDDMVGRCSTEYDRLIEQSPPPPKEIIDKFERTFRKTNDFEKPEISNIQPIEAFDQTKENVVTSTVKDVFKKGLKLFGKADNKPAMMRRDTMDNGISAGAMSAFKDPETDRIVGNKNKVMNELQELKKKNLVSLRGSGEEEEFQDSSEVAIEIGNEVDEVEPQV
jgi:hypothetical protein